VDVINVNEFENPAVKQKWEDHAINCSKLYCFSLRAVILLLELNGEAWHFHCCVHLAALDSSIVASLVI
jgi:hypothetical protein